MSDVRNTLANRQQTHGNYEDRARITQQLKYIISKELKLREQRGDAALTASMRESIDMILHKLGRIIAGNPRMSDHWHDIAGYATLVEMQILTRSENLPTPSEIAEKVNAGKRD